MELSHPPRQGEVEWCRAGVSARLGQGFNSTGQATFYIEHLDSKLVPTSQQVLFKQTTLVHVNSAEISWHDLGMTHLYVPWLFHLELRHLSI